MCTPKQKPRAKFKTSKCLRLGTLQVTNEYFKDVFTNENTQNVPNVPPKPVESILNHIYIDEETVLKKF